MAHLVFIHECALDYGFASACVYVCASAYNACVCALHYACTLAYCTCVHMCTIEHYVHCIIHVHLRICKSVHMRIIHVYGNIKHVTHSCQCRLDIAYALSMST